MKSTMELFNERILAAAGIEATSTPEVIAVIQGARNHKVTQFTDFSFDADSIMTAIADGKAGFTPHVKNSIGKGGFYVDLSGASNAVIAKNDSYFNAMVSVTVYYDQSTDERSVDALEFSRRFKLKFAGTYKNLMNEETGEVTE